MEATCVDGIHHVTDQVDLSSQMLNSRESTMATQERRRGRSWTNTPQLGDQLPPRELHSSEMVPGSHHTGSFLGFDAPSALCLVQTA